MGYITGVCNSYDELLGVFVSLCTTAGWSQTTDTNGKTVLYKSAKNLYIMVETGPKPGTPSTPDCLRIQGRTSINGGSDNTPTKVGISDCYPTSSYGTAGPVTFPVTYFGFYYADVEEIYFIISYNQMYQFIAFGQSTISLPGTGLWIAGAFGLLIDPTSIDTSNNNWHRPKVFDVLDDGGSPDHDRPCPAFFWNQRQSTNYAPANNYYIHNNLDTNYPWSLSNNDYTYSYNKVGVSYLTWFLRSQPQEFNKEALLLPIHVFKRHHVYSGQFQHVMTAQKARYLKINYLDPETIITKGDDQWVVFPFFKKVYQDVYWRGANPITHTGVFGWAIKKEV